MASRTSALTPKPRIPWLALLLALLGPGIGFAGYWMGREGARESVLAYLPLTGQDRAVTLGIELFLGYELLLGLLLVTQAWAREKHLRRHNELMGSVIGSITEGVVVANTAGRFLVVNDAARRMVGGNRHREVSKAEWSDVYGLYVPGTDRLFPTDELPLAKAIRGEPIEETEVLVRSPHVPGGTWVSVTGVPLRDKQGVLLGGVAVFRDITDRKHAEALAQRLSSAVEQTADCVLITDRAGRIEYVNPAFEETTGYSRAEALGNTPRLLKSGRQGPATYGTLWSSILEGKPYKATVINRKKSGEHFIAEQTITPMRDSRSGEISHFVSVMRDLTQRHQLEEQGAELSMAASVQRRLFPRTPPQIAGYDIAGAFSPALATCGDYFDFIQLPDDRLAFAAADVSGHGLGPALIMAATRAYLRSLAHSGMPLERLVPDLNRLLLADLDERHYVTMLTGFLDTRSGSLTWANMGHPSGYVLDAGGEVKLKLGSTCKPLGMFPDIGCALGTPMVLQPGDVVLLMTDGVIEAADPDGQEHGAAAALAVAREHRNLPAQEIVERVITATRAHSQGEAQEDDITVVVVKRTGAPGAGVEGEGRVEGTP